MAVTNTLPRPQTARREAIQHLQPMGLAQSVVLFGVPAALLVSALYVLQPALISAGLSGPISYTISLTLINIGLLVAAVVGYRHEGHPMTWNAFASRLRLGGMGRREWAWTIVGIIVLAAVSLAVSWVLVVLFRMLNFTQPAFGSTGGDQLLLAIVLVFNIVGEELWWRGYILPRQELTWGSRTWLLHGVLWGFYHVYKWWVVPGMIVTSMVVPFIAQRLKNTTPGMLVHFTVNALGSIAFIVALIMQLIQGG